MKNDPGNCIMRDFYHPARLRSAEVPHILGLTASPIMRSKPGDIRCVVTETLSDMEGTG